MSRESPKSNDDKFDLWLSRSVRAMAAAVGVGIIVYETVIGGNIEFALMAVGMMGLPFGKAVENFLSWVASFRDDPTNDRKER